MKTYNSTEEWFTEIRNDSEKQIEEILTEASAVGMRDELKSAVEEFLKTSQLYTPLEVYEFEYYNLIENKL